jgi:hypothetical protein
MTFGQCLRARGCEKMSLFFKGPENKKVIMTFDLAVVIEEGTYCEKSEWVHSIHAVLFELKKASKLALMKERHIGVASSPIYSLSAEKWQYRNASILTQSTRTLHTAIASQILCTFCDARDTR